MVKVRYNNQNNNGAPLRVILVGGIQLIPIK